MVLFEEDNETPAFPLRGIQREINSHHRNRTLEGGVTELHAHHWAVAQFSSLCEVD